MCSYFQIDAKWWMHNYRCVIDNMEAQIGSRMQSYHPVERDTNAVIIKCNDHELILYP